MTKYNSAFDEIRGTYDDAALEKICISGDPEKHKDPSKFIPFFDEYEAEIKDFIDDSEGGEFTSELWWNNTCDIEGYKRDMVWTFIECVAQSICNPEDEEEED